MADDNFKALVQDYLIKMLEATGMGDGRSVPHDSPEGKARMTAAFAQAMYMEWLINSAPWPQAQREAVLKEARALARAITTDLASTKGKVKTGAN